MQSSGKVRGAILKYGHYSEICCSAVLTSYLLMRITHDSAKIKNTKNSIAAIANEAGLIIAVMSPENPSAAIPSYALMVFSPSNIFFSGEKSIAETKEAKSTRARNMLSGLQIKADIA